MPTLTQAETRTIGNRTWTGFLCVIAIAALLVATLFPFNPFPNNKVSWLPQASGVRFRWGGVVVSKSPLRLPDTANDGCALELLVRPVTVELSGAILGFYAPGRRRHFEVRQWNDGLLLTHNVSVSHDPTHTIKIDIDHVFHAGRLTQITISSGSSGTTVYVDGQPAGFFPQFKISHSDLAGDVVLGTSWTTEVWPGELHGVAIYVNELTPSRALSHYGEWIAPTNSPDLDGAVARYAFTEAAGNDVHNEVPSEPGLEIPKSFYVPHKPFLQTPAQEFDVSWVYLGDVMQNVAGFVPLGLVLCSFFAWKRSRWQSVICTTVACGVLSFIIEVLQYYIPQRGSGVTDIITNTLGGALGAILAETWPIRRILEAMRVMPTNRVALEETEIRR